MGKVTLLALEENGNVWGLGHFVGNHGGREATGKEKGRGAHLGQELQGRGVKQEESFSEMPTQPPGLRSPETEKRAQV